MGERDVQNLETSPQCVFTNLRSRIHRHHNFKHLSMLHEPIIEHEEPGALCEVVERSVFLLQ